MHLEQSFDGCRSLVRWDSWQTKKLFDPVLPAKILLKTTGSQTWVYNTCHRCSGSTAVQTCRLHRHHLTLSRASKPAHIGHMQQGEAWWYLRWGKDPGQKKHLTMKVFKRSISNSCRVGFFLSTPVPVCMMEPVDEKANPP